ncbi:CRISPR-associated endonuclease Cas2 [Actinobacillus equuli]|uniref:CRISPR-associated endonuclease Cas2 n=1 Tax=Actinobacillus equuli TaxID=718 RepID=UPI002442DA6D|nr:CRISPR-associated endonuclease Cas2 [Actinobacillus equuli]WGE82999.1 CRISPR-associated endonuclease Cas2 [Actinobacillus equuli subsp. equuli]WGE85075.1 CRISPR-associated endonuclease Cas2 [Actinobacillus equuli subsp. haemolyticus]
MGQSRIRYLVAYDIACPKRRYRIHTKLSAYAVGGQKSFYECWLTASELLQFKQQLLDIMDNGEDRLLIFQLPKNTQPILFGTATLPTFDRPFLIT